MKITYNLCRAGLLLDLHLSKLHIITNSNNGERDLRGDGNAMKADPRATRVVRTCSDGAVPRPIRIPYMDPCNYRAPLADLSRMPRTPTMQPSDARPP